MLKSHVLALAVFVLQARCATGSALGGEEAGEARSGCGGGKVPAGWPDLTLSDALLAPFLACTSPADFVGLQGGVDMARLVERLDDWSAVRLGALGPVSAKAAEVLNRKRAAFLSDVVRERGVGLGEVFALYVLHTAADADVKQVLGALARDRRLERTLGGIAVVGEQLRRRGLSLSDFPDRPVRPREDVARGVKEGLKEAVASAPVLQWGEAMEYEERKRQLPAPYQKALEQVEGALVEKALDSEQVALGMLDEVTFGVPLGIYYLAVGTGRGVKDLSEGEYEQAARELTPAALLVAVYAGGKGTQTLAEARGGAAVGEGRLQSLEVKLEEWRATVGRLKEGMGGEGLEEMARWLQADPEAAWLVAEGGEAGALALHEARGDVPRARAWLSQAKGERKGARAAGGGGMSAGVERIAAGVDEATIPREVLRERLAEGERATPGSRMSGDVEVLRKQLADQRQAPPVGAESHPLWGEYVRYGEERLAELEQGGKGKKGRGVEPPLQWEGYQRMRGLVKRGLDFERAMTEVLRADAALPRAQRRFLGDFEQPRVEQYVGVWKEGSELRFADVLVIEESPLVKPPPRVETFSFKSRDLSGLKGKSLRGQIVEDARQALNYYGEVLDIRRPTLKPLVGASSEVSVSRVRLIYEGRLFKPNDVNRVKMAMSSVESAVPGVEVLFQ